MILLKIIPISISQLPNNYAINDEIINDNVAKVN